MFQHLDKDFIGENPGQIDIRKIRLPANLFEKCPWSLAKVEDLEEPVLVIPWGQQSHSLFSPQALTSAERGESLRDFKNKTLTQTYICEKAMIDEVLRSNTNYPMPGINTRFQRPPDYLDQQFRNSLSPLMQKLTQPIIRIPAHEPEDLVAWGPWLKKQAINCGLVLIGYYILTRGPTMFADHPILFLCFAFAGFVIFAFSEVLADILSNPRNFRLQWFPQGSCPVYIPLDRGWIINTQTRLRQYENDPQYANAATKIQSVYRGHRCRKSLATREEKLKID